MNTGSINLPWGDWLVLLLNQLAPIAIALVVALITWLCRFLPAALVSVIKEQLTQAKIDRAVHWAFAKVEGAEKGQTLTIDHVNQLEAWALQYGMQMFPQLVGQLGDAIGPMILAKISQLATIPTSAPNAGALPTKPVQKPFVKVPA